MRCIDELSRDELRGKRVLVRAGLDLPVDERGEVTDSFRVQRAIPTLKYLSESGAKVIILSHIGREVGETNEPVSHALVQYIRASYVPDLFGHTARNVIQGMGDGDVLLLENVRQDERETGNDPSLSEELASLGEMYVNDAFSNSHRAHASMVGIPKLLPHYAGLLLRDEVRELAKSRTPAHPSFAVIGGAKFETKVPVITQLLETYDYVFITGALANDVFKARGLPVGRSKVSNESPDERVLKHHGFLAPVDVTVEDEYGRASVKKPAEVAQGDKIVDIGPDTLLMIGPHISQAQSIVWNGPTGLYEDGYISFTHGLAELVRHRVAEGAHSVIGGNNTIAAIHSSGIPERELGFLSTGGGAMLEFLAQGTLPAIDALS